MTQNKIILLSIVFLVFSTFHSVAETEIDAAVKRLSAPEDYNRSRAAQALGLMGEDAKATYDALLNVALSDDVPKVRHAAADALGKIAKRKALNLFIARLQTDSDPLIRKYAVNALMQLSLRSPQATVPLFHALRDDDEDVRKTAATALQFHLNEELEILLLDSLSDPTDKARKLAPWLLGRMKSEASLSPLHHLLHDDSPNFRKSVVASLRDIGSKTSVLPLVRVVTNDENDEVRMRAIECLGELGDSQAAATVVAALDDKNPEVQVYAMRAAGVLGIEDSKPYLRKILKDRDGREKLAALGALCYMKDTASIPVIVDYLMTEDVTTENDVIASYMMRGLSDLGAESALLDLQAQGRPQIRSFAKNLLEKLRKSTDKGGERSDKTECHSELIPGEKRN